MLDRNLLEIFKFECSTFRLDKFAFVRGRRVNNSNHLRALLWVELHYATNGVTASDPHAYFEAGAGVFVIHFESWLDFAARCC